MSTFNQHLTFMPTDKTPLVSICIPTYNGEKFIEETLDSAISQTYKNIEIIITDDCSTDNTLSICELYAQKDARIKIFKNPHNLGLIGNWNQSIEKASSDWIKFLFQDDLLKPTCVEEMIYEAIDKNVNFVISSREYLFDNISDERVVKGYSYLLKSTRIIFKNKTIYSPTQTAKAIAPYVFINCLGEPPTFLFKKQYYKKSDFPTQYYQLMDYIFVLNKIITQNFVFISKPLLIFRIHNDSESMKNSNLKSLSKATIEKQIYIQFYEKILICDTLLNNPNYIELKKNISVKNILIIKKWLIYKSYKKFGFTDSYIFFKSKGLKTYLIKEKLIHFNIIRYFLYKKFNKKIIKKFKI